MKKKWLLIIVFFLLIVFLLLPKVIIFSDAYKTLKLSESEIYKKQRYIYQNEVRKIIYNDKELDEVETKGVLYLVRQLEFNTTKISINTKDKIYNNSLEILTSANEKIKLNFNFNENCRGSYVEVEKGMITIEANKLCEYLKEIED